VPESLLGTEVSIKVLVEDQLGASNSYTVKIEIPKPKEPEPEPVAPPPKLIPVIEVEETPENDGQWVLPIAEEKEPEIIINCTASIFSISARGQLDIRFSTEMLTTINLTQVNTTMIDIYIVPAENRHLSDGFNITKLNFTWNATEFYYDTLTIMLDFPNPSYVSILKE